MHPRSYTYFPSKKSRNGKKRGVTKHKPKSVNFIRCYCTDSLFITFALRLKVNINIALITSNSLKINKQGIIGEVLDLSSSKKYSSSNEIHSGDQNMAFVSFFQQGTAYFWREKWGRRCCSKGRGKQKLDFPAIWKEISDFLGDF